MSSGDIVSRVYSNFRGVDFRGDEINLVRSPNSLNVWKDYKEIDSIRTRPEMELLHSFNDTIYGVFFYKIGTTEMMLVHSGTRLYKVVNGVKTLLRLGGENQFLQDVVCNQKNSNAFIYNNIWYFLDGKNYLCFDGQYLTNVEGYVPTTSKTRTTTGSGQIFEDANMLSDYRINTFRGDGTSTVFYLDAQNVEDIVSITCGDIDYSREYMLYAEEGKIELKNPPPAPLTDGQDNLVVKFKKTVEGYKERIMHCTLLQVFDNRVFFSGNPDYPNMIWHCSLNDPTYCSDTDYYNEGLDSAKVTGMVAGNNALWVFKEPSQANTTVFYHTPTIDSDYGKVYPSQHSSIATGCVGKAINFNDDIVFFSEIGMEGISGDVATEQVVAHRSSLIDRKLIAESNYKDMILEEWEGYLMTFIDNKVYLADSRAVFTNEDHIEYEWFHWELDKKITCVKVHKGILYLGTDDGVYSLTDTTSDVESWWVTPKDKFKYPQYLKTTNKRGCVVESTGDISVYAKTEKTDFELIGTYENITDSFVCRIKRKKFKDIQLKFYSKKRFSLETATLECFVGGYIKR